MNEARQVPIADWARQIPLEQVPAMIAYLAARLIAEGHGNDRHHEGARRYHTDKLLKAGELAERLNLPETWIRNEERMGRLPSVRAGKYVRFKLGEVENALAERKRLGI
jgi:hypothetical protein